MRTGLEVGTHATAAVVVDGSGVVDARRVDNRAHEDPVAAALAEVPEGALVESDRLVVVPSRLLDRALAADLPACTSVVVGRWRASTN